MKKQFILALAGLGAFAAGCAQVPPTPLSDTQASRQVPPSFMAGPAASPGMSGNAGSPALALSLR